MWREMVSGNHPIVLLLISRSMFVAITHLYQTTGEYGSDNLSDGFRLTYRIILGVSEQVS